MNGTLPYRLPATELIVVDDLRAGTPSEIVAARFHNGIARTIVDVCSSLRERTAVSLVALSGGVFQNLLLLERTVGGLEARRFRVLTHARLPPNDARPCTSVKEIRLPLGCWPVA